MDGPFTIRTQRLEIIAGNHEMAVAEMTNILNLSTLLRAGFDFGWPPPENNEQTMEWFFTRIYDNPHHRGWLLWYFIHLQNDKHIAIGNGGFTGPPDSSGTVECGYAILEPAQRQGFATEAVEALVHWAFEHEEVNRVIARTKANHTASKKVLENNGFGLAESMPDGEVIYEIRKNREW